MSEQIAVEPTKLELVIAETGVDQERALTICAEMSPFFAQAEEWKAKVNTVTDPTVARKSRLVLKNIRVEAGHKKKALKDSVNKLGNAIEAAFHLIEETISPMEETLEAVEKKAEREEAERKAKIKTEREVLLAPFGINTAFYDLANMPADTFAQLFEGSKAAHDAKLAAAKKAEEERIAKEKAEAEKIEAQRLENERLKKEAFEQEQRLQKEREENAAKQEKLRLELEQAEETARKQKAELEAKAKKEREVIEAKARAEKAAAEEKARKEREAQEAQLRKEREAREKLEAEAAAKAKAEIDARAAKEAAERKAARAPDREKVLALAATIRAFPIPTATTQEGKDVVWQIAEQFEKMAIWLTRKAGEL